MRLSGRQCKRYLIQKAYRPRLKVGFEEAYGGLRGQDPRV